uniref:G-protein coupled receptors family 1 profile domain-containing protein n=1 Tax=Acrobeloides nanus TaxID=290746 RepID=A0A914E9V4_9BILA
MGIEESFLYNPHGCVLAALPQLFGIMFGQVIILAMAIDRLLAVCKPAEYKKNNKQMRIYTVNLIAFGAGIFFCLFSILSVKPDNMKDRPCTAGANNTKLFQTFGFISGLIIASVIFTIYLCTVCMIKRFAKINDISMGLVFQRQRRVFVSISLILLFYAIFWCLPMVFVGITNHTKFGIQFVGYNSIVISLCAGLNSCVGIFVYLAKHSELRRYYLNIYCSMFVRISREDSHLSHKFLSLNYRKNDEDVHKLSEVIDL